MVSTFKIITLAASIEEKTVDLLNDTFYDGGSITVEGARIRCWKAGGHGAQTYLQVVQNSCNIGGNMATLFLFINLSYFFSFKYLLSKNVIFLERNTIQIITFLERFLLI